MKAKLWFLWFVALVLFILVAPAVYSAEGDGPSTQTVVVRERYNYRHISAADNTVIKASPGMFAGLTVNGGTTTGSITVYDNVTCVGSTTIVAIVTAPSAGAIVPGGANMTRGLCVTTSTAMDLTVYWK